MIEESHNINYLAIGLEEIDLRPFAPCDVKGRITKTETKLPQWGLNIF